MTYELAKKLKDSGFPETRVRHETFGYKEIDFICPTLEELIEECGDGFESLGRGWAAKGNKISEPFEVHDETVSPPYHNTAISVLPIESKGKTPEEAVANLWLKLNKNASTHKTL